MNISAGLGVIATISVLVVSASPSKAAISLSSAYAYAANCPSSYGNFCSLGDVYSEQQFIHYNQSSAASVNPSPGTSASGFSGSNGATALPLLRANAAAPLGSAIQTASGEFGVQGFVWKGATGTVLPLVGNADFTIPTSYTFPSDPKGWAFVSGQIAVVDDSLQSRSVIPLWLSDNGSGELTAGCGTTGALAISNFGFDASAGPGSFTVNAGTGCTGNALKLAHGEKFFVLSTLSAFAYRGGSADASSTFMVDLSPGLSASQRAYILDNLSPASLAIPEPGAWLLMSLSMILGGAALRAGRRSAMLPSRI